MNLTCKYLPTVKIPEPKYGMVTIPLLRGGACVEAEQGAASVFEFLN